MFKTLSTLLFVMLLSACSAEDSKKKSNTVDSNQTETKTSKQTNQIVENQAIATTTQTKTATEEKNVSKAEVLADVKKTATDKSPTFELKTLDGKIIHAKETKSGLIFEEHPNKIIYLLFFGYKCPPCLAEIPHLINIAGEDKKDMEIIALEVQGLSEEQLKEFKEKKGINYTLIAGKNHYPFIDYIAQKANWSGSIPFLIVFDKKGDVQVVQVGQVSEKSLRNVYESLTTPTKK